MSIILNEGKKLKTIFETESLNVFLHKSGWMTEVARKRECDTIAVHTEGEKHVKDRLRYRALRPEGQEGGAKRFLINSALPLRKP